MKGNKYFYDPCVCGTAIRAVRSLAACCLAEEKISVRRYGPVPGKRGIMGSLKKERRILVLKKLASLLLSLLICLSLLPGQADAANTKGSGLPLQTEASEVEHPDDPDNPDAPVMLLTEELPEEKDTRRGGG